MQKRKANLIISWMIVNLLVFSPTANAIDLQTKTKNTDKSNYNVTPSIQIIPERFSFFAETNYSLNPLVTRGAYSGKVNPLVTSILGLDLIANYGFNDWIQVGAMLPLEMPMGTEKSGMLVSGPLLEAKFRVFDYLAIVPTYQLPSSSSIKVNNEGVTQEVKLGAPKGAYGIKLVGEIGDINSSYGMAAQLGYVSSPENKFSTIDQSSRILMSVSGGMAFTKSMSGVVEIYGEKTPSNFPIEVIGFINLRGEAFNFQVGGGSGDLQGSGSNAVKAFVGLSYSFGGSKKGFYNPTKAQREWNRARDNKQPQYLEDGIDEQNGPKVLEPESPQEPMIPDVNDSSSIERPFRGLASVEEKDPLAEILNPPAKVIKNDKKVESKKPVKKLPAKKKTSVEVVSPEEIKEAQKILEKEFKPVSKPVEKKVEVKDVVKEIKKEQKVEVKEAIKEVKKEQKVEVKEAVKEVKKVKAKKKNKEVDFSKSRLETLSNGEKVRVFEKEVNILPKEIGVIYTTEEGLKEMKAKIAKEAKEVKVVAPVEAKAIEESVEIKNVNPITLESKPIKDEDPIPLMQEHQEELSKEIEPELVPVPLKAQENIVKPENIQAETPALIPVEDKKEQKVEVVESTEKSLTLPEAQSEELTTVEKESTVNPITLESVRKSKAELKKILEEELSVSTEDRIQEIRQKAKEENLKVEAEILKIQEKKAAQEKEIEEAQKAEELAKKEKEIRTEKDLTEGPETQVPQAPATKKELKAVKIDNKKSRSITLPKMNAFLEGKKLERDTVPNASAEDLNLLEETDGLEEAQGPNYGFGEE